MDLILPEREYAQKVGWTHQVQWIEGGKPCFIRCKSGMAADARADDLKRKGLDPIVIDLHDVLQVHAGSLKERKNVKGMFQQEDESDESYQDSLARAKHLHDLELLADAAREWRKAFEKFSKDDSYRNAFPYSQAKNALIAALDALGVK